ARGAILTRHDVHRDVDEVGDLRVRLADTGRFHEDQVETSQLQQPNHVAQHSARGTVLTTCRERTHEDVLGRERVHADAIAQQRTTRTAARRIDCDDSNLLIGEVTYEA